MGCLRANRNPKMRDFLFGVKNNVEIFDLEKVHQKLDEAKNFVKTLGKEERSLLFVGTKSDLGDIIEASAKAIKMPYVKERWLGGTLTNFKAINKRSEYLQDLIQKKETGELEKYTKKEKSQLEKKIFKMKRYFEGLNDLKDIPGVVIIIDTNEEKIAVAEARKNSVPTIGIMNSDCNPDDVNYVVPSNDNSRLSVEFLLNELVSAYKEGVEANKEARIKNKDAGEEKSK